MVAYAHAICIPHRYQQPGWRWQGSAPDLPPLFDFALDARRTWKNKAEVSALLLRADQGCVYVDGSWCGRDHSTVEVHVLGSSTLTSLQLLLAMPAHAAGE